MYTLLLLIFLFPGKSVAQPAEVAQFPQVSESGQPRNLGRLRYLPHRFSLFQGGATRSGEILENYPMTDALVAASVSDTAQSQRQAPPSPDSSGKPDFSGNWQLSRELSEGLQNTLAKTEVVLKVEQTASQIKIEQRVKFRGRDQSVTVYTYNLDGTPSELPVSRPAPGKAQLHARWLDKGRTLELRSTLKAKVADEEVTVTTREYWELLDHGKVLKINRSREQPSETQHSRLIFDKQ